MAKRAVSALFLMGFALQIAFAQTQAINGSIRGRVTDAAGASVPKANVTAANTDTGYSRAFETPEDGYFVFPNLPLGTYTVTVQKTGFDTQKFTNIVLDAGKEAVLEAALKVGSVSTTVEVTTGAPVIEPSRVSTGRTIEHDEVDNLPLTSRNPYNFVIFQPGVSGHPNPELGIPRTINTNGLLDRINYQMDGMVNTESDRYGLRLFPISDIYVREVQTVSNSFAPEFGQTSGSIYNVITNSGTNAYHGEFYFIGRPPDAVARPILLAANKVAPAIDLHDYAVNSSGAIIKDKLFIFGGYEHLLRALPSPNTINQTTAAQIGLTDALLATAPAVQHAQFLNLRLDYIINQKHQIFIRYNYFRNEYPFNTAVGGTSALDVAQDFHDRAHIIGMQFLSTFTPTLLNEFRGSIPYRNEAHAANPADGPGPRITVTGIATFNGYGPGFPGDHFSEKIPSLSDNVTWLKGAHSFKMGIGWQENNDNQLNSITYNTYNFATAAAYLAAKAGTSPLGYSSYQTAVGLPGTSYKSYFYNLYAQDSWQLRPNLLVTYGIRWDRFQAPSDQPNEPFIYSRSFHTPNRDWAPRLGFAWTITPKTVIRTNFGLFYEAPPTNLWFNALAVDGARSFTASYAPSTPGAPAFPAVISSTLGATPATPPSIISVTPNFKNAYTINANFQITREISKNDALTVGYIHTAGRDQGYLRDMNLINPISFLADGRPVYSSTATATSRLFPQFNAIRLQDVGAISDYNAMIVSWNHRLTRGVLISANYTWSHSISDAPDANSFEQNIAIEDPTSRARERGNSIVNRPNAFHLSAVLAPSYKTDNAFLRRLINGNQLTILGQLSSGDQQNITSSVQPLNGDSDTASQRPLYIGRDTVRGPKVIQFDARYTRTIFKFRERFFTKVLAEANNVTNHKNITSLNTSVPTTSAGVPTLPAFYPGTSTVLEGRIIQLGIRADW